MTYSIHICIKNRSQIVLASQTQVNSDNGTLSLPGILQSIHFHLQSSKTLLPFLSSHSDKSQRPNVSSPPAPNQLRFINFIFLN